MGWASKPEPEQGNWNTLVSAGNSSDLADNEVALLFKRAGQMPSGSSESRMSPLHHLTLLRHLERKKKIPGFLVTRTTVLLRFGRICRIGLRVVHR